MKHSWRQNETNSLYNNLINDRQQYIYIYIYIYIMINLNIKYQIHLINTH
jgi:hypothetical protein